jgi:hypothetical protein
MLYRVCPSAPDRLDAIVLAVHPVEEVRAFQIKVILRRVADPGCGLMRLAAARLGWLMVSRHAHVTPDNAREPGLGDDRGNFFPGGRKACYTHAFLPRSSL